MPSKLLLAAKAGGIKGSSWENEGKQECFANQVVSVLCRHLLVKVVHRPEEEVGQLAGQVAQVANRGLVHRPTHLRADFFNTNKKKNICTVVLLVDGLDGPLAQAGW